MNEIQKVLVVTPHPDDAESGAGGTIAKLCREGKEVVLVVCTNGDKGSNDRDMKPEILAKIREKEQLESAKVLGLADVVFLRYPDQGLEDSVEFREDLVRVIRERRPNLVITIDSGNRYIRHRDHFNCSRVTLDAVFPYARDHMAFPEHLEAGLEPHNVPEVWLFRPSEPDLFIDITDTFDVKYEALYKHASQVGERSWEREERARNRASEVGKKIGVKFAEQFKRVELFR